MDIPMDRLMVFALNKTVNTELVALCSSNIYNAEGFARGHGNPGVYDSFSKMLGDSDIYAVFFATPNPTWRIRGVCES